MKLHPFQQKIIDAIKSGKRMTIFMPRNMGKRAMVRALADDPMRRHPLSFKLAGGRFKGETFELEHNIKNMPGNEDSLPMLASQGNMAAHNALKIDKYTYDDGPFYYGKIKGLGYIISAIDIGI